MKFEKTIFPVLTGVENIKKAMEKIEIDENFQLASVKSGIPCIIANGSVMRIDGTEFENSALNNRFAWLTERLSLMKAVVCGTLYIDELFVKGSYKNTYNFFPITDIIESTSQYMQKKVSSVNLEINDIFITGATDLKLEIRVKIIENLTKDPKSIGIKSSDIFNVEKKNTIDELISFITYHSKNGSKVRVSPKSLPYIHGNCDIKNQKAFIADAFEMVSGEITEIKKSIIKDYTKNNEEVEVMDFIRVSVSVNKKKIKSSIPAMDMNISTNKYILRLIESNKLKDIVFRAIISEKGKDDYFVENPTHLS